MSQRLVLQLFIAIIASSAVRCSLSVKDLDMSEPLYQKTNYTSYITDLEDFPQSHSKPIRRLKQINLQKIEPINQADKMKSELMAVDLKSVCIISKNGRCGKDYGKTTCASGFCSPWGWCGNGTAHKRNHQAAYSFASCKDKESSCNLSKNGRCGKDYGKTICESGFCSQWGWCGTTAAHKSNQQAAYSATACKDKKPSCNLSKNGRCGKEYGKTICASGFCSQWGWCGTGAAHKRNHQAAYSATACKDKKPSCNLSKNGRCGKEYGKTICASGFCSQWGWCGTGAAHKRNHQAAYSATACKKEAPVKSAIDLGRSRPLRPKYGQKGYKAWRLKFTSGKSAAWLRSFVTKENAEIARQAQNSRSNVSRKPSQCSPPNSRIARRVHIKMLFCIRRYGANSCGWKAIRYFKLCKGRRGLGL